MKFLNSTILTDKKSFMNNPIKLIKKVTNLIGVHINLYTWLLVTKCEVGYTDFFDCNFDLAVENVS